MLYFPHVKQTFSQSKLLSHELILCKQITRVREDFKLRFHCENSLMAASLEPATLCLTQIYFPLQLYLPYRIWPFSWLHVVFYSYMIEYFTILSSTLHQYLLGCHLHVEVTIKLIKSALTHLWTQSLQTQYAFRYIRDECCHPGLLVKMFVGDYFSLVSVSLL